MFETENQFPPFLVPHIELNFIILIFLKVPKTDTNGEIMDWIISNPIYFLRIKYMKFVIFILFILIKFPDEIAIVVRKFICLY